MKSRVLSLSPRALLLVGLFLLAAGLSLVAFGMNGKKPSGVSWVTWAGAGLIGPACGSSSNTAPTCSGATPIVTISWSADIFCDGGTAYVDVGGSNVGGGSCDGSYQWTGGSIGQTYSYEVWANRQGSRHTIGTGSFTMPASCAPTAALSASPSTIDSGQSSTLTWSSVNATSCVSGGGFSTGGATSGSASTGALSTSSTYQVTCTGLGGTSNPAFATVTVLIPTASISASPDRVLAGGTTTVAWTSENVNSCTITRNNAAWRNLTADESRIVAGTTTDTITTQTTYRMICSNNAGSSAVTTTQVANVVPGFTEF